MEVFLMIISQEKQMDSLIKINYYLISIKSLY